jgi:hypothetical protein
VSFLLKKKKQLAVSYYKIMYAYNDESKVQKLNIFTSMDLYLAVQ